MLPTARSPVQETMPTLDELHGDAAVPCFAAGDERIFQLAPLYDSGPDRSDEELDYLAARAAARRLHGGCLCQLPSRDRGIEES